MTNYRERFESGSVFFSTSFEARSEILPTAKPASRRSTSKDVSWPLILVFSLSFGRNYLNESSKNIFILVYIPNLPVSCFALLCSGLYVIRHNVYIPTPFRRCQRPTAPPLKVFSILLIHSTQMRPVNGDFIN